VLAIGSYLTLRLFESLGDYFGSFWKKLGRRFRKSNSISNVYIIPKEIPPRLNRHQGSTRTQVEVVTNDLLSNQEITNSTML